MPDSYIVLAPQALPGACALCGGASKAWYWDTGLFFDRSFEISNLMGALYLCCDCFTAVAQDAWYMSPVAVMELREKQERLETEIAQLRSYIETQEVVIDELRGNHHAQLGLSNASGRPSLPVDVAEQGASQPTPDVGPGAALVTKQSDDERLGELHDSPKGGKGKGSGFVL